MYGHGFGLLFLASRLRRGRGRATAASKLEGILTRAVEFTGKAQSSRGGWYYIVADRGRRHGRRLGDRHPGAGPAGGPQCRHRRCPRAIIDKAQEYLKKCTTPRGGIIYSLSQGGGPERPALTAAGVACMFNAGPVQFAPGQAVAQLLPDRHPAPRRGRSHRPRRVHPLLLRPGPVHPGGRGLRQALPGIEGERTPDAGASIARRPLRSWSRARTATAAGTAPALGPHRPGVRHRHRLTILQLDNGTLPIYQR